MLNSKANNFTNFYSLSVLTRDCEMLKKTSLFFFMSFFNLVILTEFYKLFNGAVEFSSLVYLFLTFIMVENPATLFCLSFMLIFIFVAVRVSLRVFFNKKVNNIEKPVTACGGVFRAVCEKFNS